MIKKYTLLCSLIFAASIKLPSAALQSRALEADSSLLESMEMRGTIGTHNIGLNYTVQDRSVLKAAHYFYAKHLKDIPLQGEVHGQTVDLNGADGSIFHLHFIGNGRDGDPPLTFYNAIGLSGSWTLGLRILPVRLVIAHSTENPGQRLYRQVTNLPDSDFEKMVAKTKEAILNNDADDTARFIHFPLRVNGLHNATILRTAAELKAHWSVIFTPAFLTKLRACVPHEMFVHEGEAMLGNGQLWFDDKGLVALNAVPDGSK